MCEGQQCISVLQNTDVLKQKNLMNIRTMNSHMNPALDDLNLK